MIARDAAGVLAAMVVGPQRKGRHGRAKGRANGSVGDRASTISSAPATVPS
jgi:hypothetical protein